MSQGALFENIKLYYSITEVAEMLNVKASLIRFWEKEFDIIKPQKNSKGNRKFTKKDIENIQMIYFLVKEKGYTLEGAKQQLKDRKKSLKDEMDVIHRLTSIKSILLEIKEGL